MTRTVLPRRTSALPLIVALLIVQFALRCHHPALQSAFVDEHHHIRRAAVVYDFDQNPVSFSHGKLLLYYWLGLFGLGGDSELALARIAIGLFSLIGSAAAAATARDLFGRRAAVPTLALYALAPYALFFERLALADPFAGALAALTAWGSIRLARKPTVRRGLAVGLLAGLTALAKLTTLGVVVLPLIALVLLRRQGRPTAGVSEGWRLRGKAVLRPLIAVLIGWALVWSGYALGLLADAHASGSTNVIDSYLVDGEPGITDLTENLRDTLDGVVILLSSPGALVLVGCTLVLLRRRTAAGLYVLVWLLALWGPSVILGSPVQTRYLAAGVPALAVLISGGIAEITRPLAPRFAGALIAGGIGLWAVGFALPFAYDASHNPAALHLPERDVSSYISGPFAGWGTRDALDYLRDHGDRIGGRIPAVGVLRHCGSIALHLTDEFAWTCIDRQHVPTDNMPADVRAWTPVYDAADTWPFVYLVTDYTEHTPLDAPPQTPPYTWELVFAVDRPRGGKTVAVWRIAAER
ncbi:MAG: glycosyltransferase family 39 protein [Anaerolineae bacterium]|nr:glycosyltransferase family 39 protein [Anaerolineae bacterium]